MLRIVVGLALIGFIISRTDVSQFAATLARINPLWLLLGILVQWSSIYIWALRWSKVSKIFEMPLPFTHLLKALFVGAFFTSFLPTSFSGDLYRAYWVVEDKQLYRKSIFAVFVERFIGLIALGYLVLPVFTLLLIQGLALEGFIIPLLLVMVILCLSVVALQPAVFNFLNRALFGDRAFLANTRSKILNALTLLHEAGSTRLVIFFYSLVIQVDGILLFYCLGRSLELPLEIWHYFLIVPPTVLVTMFLPISFNGLGVREASLVLLTTLLGVAVLPGEAVALGVLALGVSLLSALIGGVIYVLSNFKAIHEFEATLERQ